MLSLITRFSRNQGWLHWIDLFFLFTFTQHTELCLNCLWFPRITKVPNVILTIALIYEVFKNGHVKWSQYLISTVFRCLKYFAAWDTHLFLHLYGWFNVNFKKDLFKIVQKLHVSDDIIGENLKGGDKALLKNRKCHTIKIFNLSMNYCDIFKHFYLSIPNKTSET